MIRVKFHSRHTETGEPFEREQLMLQVPAIGEHVTFGEQDLGTLRVLSVVWDLAPEKRPGEFGVPPTVAVVRLEYIG